MKRSDVIEHSQPYTCTNRLGRRDERLLRGQLKCDGTRTETIFRLSRETDQSI